MWTKYDYLCTDCDTLIEITTQQEHFFEPECPCNRDRSESKVIKINRQDIDQSIDTIDMLDSFKSQTGIVIDSLDVMKVTHNGLVKINTNPYN